MDEFYCIFLPNAKGHNINMDSYYKIMQDYEGNAVLSVYAFYHYTTLTAFISTPLLIQNFRIKILESKFYYHFCM